jgi:hypothetical protein
MSEGNGYATKDDLFADVWQRSYVDHEQIFNGVKRRFRLQNLHDGEKGQFDSDAVNGKGKFKRQSIATANARIIQLCWVNGDGQRQLSNADVSRLQQYDSAEVEELASACRLHCGWVEEPEKNSDMTDDDDSPTVSSGHSTHSTTNGT